MKIVTIACASILTTTCVNAAEFRQWTNSTGEFHASAQFIALKEDRATLKKSSGRSITVPIGRLSKSDREHIAAMSRVINQPALKAEKNIRQPKVVANVPATTQVALRAVWVAEDPEFEGNLLDDPDVQKSIERLRRNTFKTIEKTTTVYKDIYENRWVRYGLFGRRCRLVRVRVGRVPEQRTVAEQVRGLEDGLGWSDISAPHLGVKERTIDIKGLPNTAGARASHVFGSASTLLSTQSASDISDRDEILTIAPTAFSAQKAPTGKTQAVRLLVKIPRPFHNSITLSVSVQQRDAATGRQILNKADLEKVADSLLTALEKSIAPPEKTATP